MYDDQEVAILRQLDVMSKKNIHDILSWIVWT